MIHATVEGRPVAALLATAGMVPERITIARLVADHRLAGDAVATGAGSHL
jgi:hypothetical protein